MMKGNTIGGPGDGPGELGYIRDLARCGADSLFVFEIDYLNVVFRIDGDYVREAQPYDANSMTRRPYAMRCARNGYYVAVGWENLQGPRTIGFYRAEAPTWILAPTHQLAVEPIESIPGAGLNVVAELGVMLSSERIGRATGSGPHPFGRALQLAISTEAVYLGTGEAFEVRRYDLNGQLVGLFRWPGHDLTIQDMDLEAYRVAALAAVSEAGRPALERSLREMPMPATLPAFSRIETDMAGNVWIESFRKPGQPSQNRRWTVIDAQGVLLGDVAIPVDLEVTDIGENAIVGVARDELGVERVCVYDLVKPVG